MTEEAWLACEDPKPMLELISNKTSPRKERLFACHCCSLVKDMLPVLRTAMEVAERFADRLTDEDELLTAWKAVDQLAIELWRTQTDEGDRNTAISASLTSITCDNDGSNIAYDAYQHLLEMTDSTLRAKRQAWTTNVIRDLFGNPFRRVTFLPEWRTSTVLSLAQGIYQDRTFDRMPILADALQDAGCWDEDILNHCRAETAHTRGCWALDLCLGKS
jgi:hypothetical protein